MIDLIEEPNFKNYKWEITPSPDKDFDTALTNEDGDAYNLLMNILECIWDEIDVGEERIIRLKRNS
jgi:hypothetical protein